MHVLVCVLTLICSLGSQLHMHRWLATRLSIEGIRIDSTYIHAFMSGKNFRPALTEPLRNLGALMTKMRDISITCTRFRICSAS